MMSEGIIKKKNYDSVTERNDTKYHENGSIKSRII